MANPNLQLLTDAAKLLNPILGESVFVGGCATALLITDSAAADVRPTFDVDTIAKIKKLILTHEFNDALPGHLPPDAASQGRVGTIISRLEEIGSL